MTDLRIQATVSADGKQASAELKRLAGDIGRTKQEMVEAAAASKAAAAALKEHTRAAGADAAETTRLREALIAARAAEVEATRGHAVATNALNTHARAAQNLAGSSGQARASMANLGQQVGDVAQGIAAGTPAFTILAQQGGQVAFAMSGMGGALGRVATFLSGPWGAAILGGAIVLGSLWSATERAAQKQEELAEKKLKTKTATERLSAAIKELNQLQGVTRQTAEEEARATLAKVDGVIEEEKKTRGLIKAKLELLDLEGKLAARFAAPSGAGATQFGQASRGFRQSSLAELLAEQDRKIAGAEAQRTGAGRNVDAFEIGRRVAASLDPAVKASRDLEKAQTALFQQFNQGKITAADYEAGLTTVEARFKATTEALRSASAAQRQEARDRKELTEENKKLAEAYNPLLAAQQDYRKALDDIAKAEARGIVGVGLAADARLSAAETLRQARLKALGATANGPIKLAGAGDITDTLSARVFANDLAREMERTLGPEGLGKELGIRTGRDFGKTALEFSQVIGNGIAGGFGRALQRNTAFSAVIERLAPGQGSIVQEESERVLKEAFNPLIRTLQSAFKADGDLAKTLGKVLGGAAVGGATADLANKLGIGLSRQGAEIGGAIGGLKGVGKALDGVVKGLGQFAPIIGSVLGGLVGGLLAPKNPFADVALTSSAVGVDSRLFNQRGEGSGAQGLSLAGAFGNQLSQLANALGGEIRAGLNLGAIGFSGEKFFFNPTGGDFKAAGNQRFNSAEEAVAAAVANALSTGAIATSPRVQAVLQRYASNVNRAVAEALKVKDLEQLLEAQGNPFAAAFRDFERQAKQRLDVARQNGFDLIEIEKLNADQRAALIRDTLAGATGSARALLDDFRFGDRAGGSVRDRLTTLGGERDRLAGLVRGGDGGQLDALADVIRQIDDLQREAFGATSEAANGRAASAALLQELIDATEARVRTAAEAAQRAAAEQLNTLQSMDGTLEDIFQNGRQQLAALQAIQAGMGGGGGGAFDFALANSVARD